MGSLLDDRLGRAIIGALDKGQTIPCIRLDGWEPWTSDDPADRAEAAEACQSCPVLEVCREAGAKEKAGVWGATDRTPRAGRPRKKVQNDAAA